MTSTRREFLTSAAIMGSAISTISITINNTEILRWTTMNTDNKN